MEWLASPISYDSHVWCGVLSTHIIVCVNRKAQSMLNKVRYVPSADLSDISGWWFQYLFLCRFSLSHSMSSTTACRWQLIISWAVAQRRVYSCQIWESCQGGFIFQKSGMELTSSQLKEEDEANWRIMVGLNFLVGHGLPWQLHVHLISMSIVVSYVHLLIILLDIVWGGLWKTKYSPQLVVIDAKGPLRQRLMRTICVEGQGVEGPPPYSIHPYSFFFQKGLSI